MGSQTGLIKIKGSHDGLTFYRAYGKDLVRKKYGPDKEQINSNPNFQRTRENITEFGGCSKIGKAMRLSLIHVKALTDGGFGNRLTKLFKLVSQQGKGIRGQRTIALSRHRRMFQHIECNIHHKLSTIAALKFVLTHSGSRNTGSVTIPSGEPGHINAPAGATHFRWVHAMGLVSDHCFDADRKGYGPIDPTLNGKGAVEYSAYHALETETPPITLTVTIPAEADLPDYVSAVQTLGIAFYQQIGTVYYPLKQGNAMRIMEVF